MKENLFKTSWEFGWGQNLGKMSQIGQGGPRATQKAPKIFGPKGPWAQFWGQGPCLLPGSWSYDKGGKPEGHKQSFPKKSTWTSLGPNIPGLDPKPQK